MGGPKYTLGQPHHHAANLLHPLALAGKAQLGNDFIVRGPLDGLFKIDSAGNNSLYVWNYKVHKN